MLGAMTASTTGLRSTLLALALALGAATASCAPQSRFQAYTPSAESDFVRVEFLEQDDDVFKFMVYSRSKEPLVIRRDEVFLVLSGQRIARTPGGLKHTYDLPPGGTHDVFVAYDLARLKEASEFSISFETAITLQGEPVSGPVLQFIRQP